MQTGDVQLIVGSNILWRWRLRRWCRERSSYVPYLWRSVLDDLLSFACEQLDPGIVAARNFLNVRPARRQAANFFQDGLAARCHKQLRVFERFSDANTDS